MLNMKRLLTWPGDLDNSSFLFNIIHRDTTVGDGVDNAQGAQSNSHCAKHIGAFEFYWATAVLRTLDFFLASVKCFVSSGQFNLNTI